MIYFSLYIYISQTFILLFQMATSAGWDGTLNAIFDDTDCKLPDSEIGETGKYNFCWEHEKNLYWLIPGDCGNFASGIGYMVLYLVLSFLIIVNMYIAVILENYSQATEDVQEGMKDNWPLYDAFFNYNFVQVSLMRTMTFSMKYGKNLIPMAPNTLITKLCPNS